MPNIAPMTTRKTPTVIPMTAPVDTDAEEELEEDVVPVCVGVEPDVTVSVGTPGTSGLATEAADGPAVPTNKLVPRSFPEEAVAPPEKPTTVGTEIELDA
jgi:hypothetical protein